MVDFTPLGPSPDEPPNSTRERDSRALSNLLRVVPALRPDSVTLTVNGPVVTRRHGARTVPQIFVQAVGATGATAEVREVTDETYTVALVGSGSGTRVVQVAIIVSTGPA